MTLEDNKKVFYDLWMFNFYLLACFFNVFLIYFLILFLFIIIFYYFLLFKYCSLAFVTLCILYISMFMCFYVCCVQKQTKSFELNS